MTLADVSRKSQKLTYKSSGVDIRKASQFVGGLKKIFNKTLSSSVLKDQGAFGSLFSFDTKSYRDPVLVSSTDGVGTKLLIAQKLKTHDTIGIDLVAMNVNDILCAGAKPLFFLDYVACGKVEKKVLNAVMRGIASGCEQSGCALIGGETAEMPGMYASDEYDLAGFAVGVVERRRLVNGQSISVGDRVIGLASSGLHSNGYSLARRIFSLSEQKKFAKELLEPTRIYVQPVLKLLDQFAIKGLAHLTGGAWYEKLTKILPLGLCFDIDTHAWPLPKIYQRILQKVVMDRKELYTTFNMGIGLAVVVSQSDVSAILKFFSQKNVAAYEIGGVVKDLKLRVRL